MAGSELSKMKVKASDYSKYLVLTPAFTISSQELIGSLQKQNIICIPFSEIFKSKTWEIDFNRLTSILKIDIPKELSPKQITEMQRHGYLSTDRIEFTNQNAGNRREIIKINGNDIPIPYSELLVFLYMAMELKKGKGGWINRQALADLEVIPDTTSTLDKIMGVVRKKIPLFNGNPSRLIENDGKGNWRLSVQPDLITHAEPKNKNWLTGKYNEVHRKVQKDRRMRNEREEKSENIKKSRTRLLNNKKKNLL